MKHEIRCLNPKCNTFLGDVALRWVEKPAVWQSRGDAEPRIFETEPKVCGAFYDCQPLLRLRDDFDRVPKTGVYAQRENGKLLEKMKHGQSRIKRWEQEARQFEESGQVEKARARRQLIDEAQRFPVVLGTRFYIRPDENAELVCRCGGRQFC